MLKLVGIGSLVLFLIASFGVVPVPSVSAAGSLPNLLPRSNSPTTNIFDVRGGQLNYEVAALEGIVARTAPQLYLSSTANDDFWLQYTVQQYGLKYTTISQTTALQNFKSAVTDGNGRVKIILYASSDPIAPAQLNMARTLAGVYSALPVSSADLKTIQSIYGAANIDTLYNLQGMFKDKISAYTWLWNLVGSSVTKAFVTTDPSGGMGFTDYIVEHESFVFDFTNSRALTSAESTEAAKLLSNYPQGTPVMGFFALGPETQTIDFLSPRELYMFPTNNVADLSLFSGLPMAMNLKQAAPTSQPTYNPTKTYITITYSQGNSLGYMFSTNLALWQQTDSATGKPIRSEIPESWTVNPVFAELAPNVLSYWYQTMYPTNSFLDGASGGAGYVHPDQLPNLASYLNIANAFSSNADISDYLIVPGIVNKLSPTLYQQYISGTSAQVLFAKLPHETQPQYASGSPVFTMTYKILKQSSYTSKDVTTGVKDLTTLASSYKFIWIFIDAVNPGQNYVLSLVKALGSSFVDVRADQFAALYQQSLGH